MGVTEIVDANEIAEAVEVSADLFENEKWNLANPTPYDPEVHYHLAGIYMIRNELTGGFYLGKASGCNNRCFGVRIVEHLSELKHGEKFVGGLNVLDYNGHFNKHFQASWNKHTNKAFGLYIVEIVEDTDISVDPVTPIEQQYLHLIFDFEPYKSLKYNIARWADAPSRGRPSLLRGRVPPPEIAEKIAQTKEERRVWKTCAYCSGDFFGYSTSTCIYCSKQCAQDGYIQSVRDNREVFIRNCKHCLHEFSTTRTLQIFCSNQCSSDHGHFKRDSNKEQYCINCKACNKNIVTTNKNRQFCDDVCSTKFFSAKQNLGTANIEDIHLEMARDKPTRLYILEIKSCKNCGCFFEGKSIQLHCSKKCSTQHSDKTRTPRPPRQNKSLN